MYQEQVDQQHHAEVVRKLELDQLGQQEKPSYQQNLELQGLTNLDDDSFLVERGVVHPKYIGKE
jgi:hypothetical protein